MRRSSPALTLLLLAPVLGELVSGHQAPLEFFNPVVFVVLALPYGCGALLCREVTRRWHAGWIGLLSLAAAYGLYEEGIVSRALFDPAWREAETLLAVDHALGVNWTYGFALIHFHVAISIVSSVLLTELLFPERRHEPWLSDRQALACGLVLALWAPALAMLARTDDPLFAPPLVLWAATAVTITGLLAVARRRRRRPAPQPGAPVPRPVFFLLLGATNMTVVFAVVFILPERGVQFPLLVSVLALLALDAATLVLLRRWSGSGTAWDDRHRLALVAGLLAFFLAFGVLSDLERLQGRTLVSLGAGVGLLWLARRVRGRPDRILGTP